jgi:WG containing repeat
MKKLLMLLFFFPISAGFAQNWEKNYDFVDNCICGLSRVKKNDKVGYVNKEGKEIIALQYDEGLTFNEGYAAVRKGSKWMYLDSTGKAVTGAVYEDAMSFSNGLAPVAKNGLYGFINTSGEQVIPFEFSNAHSFTEGLAPAANAKGFWGYIDARGNWAIGPVYDYSDNFASGEARVIKNSKVFYIDRNNKVLHD